MDPEQQAAEIEKLKENLCTRDIELKYLRSTNGPIAKEIERYQRILNAAEQLEVENKQLREELEKREIEAKWARHNEASGFGWRKKADEKDEEIKDLKQDIENMKSEIHAAKRLETDHQSLQREHDDLKRHFENLNDHFEEMEKDYGNMRYEKTKVGKKSHDLETSLGRKTRECLKAKHALEHVSHLLMQSPFANAQSWIYPLTGLARTMQYVLAFASNWHKLPPVVYWYLQNQFTADMTSLCMINDFQFNTAAMDFASGLTYVQEKVCGYAATVPRHRGGACESCVTLGRICLQKEDYYPVVVVPLPEYMRSGKKVEDLGYWVRGW
ncbi:hypothetical protein KCU65_g10003, partial [Aureobasidium melanogenum]